MNQAPKKRAARAKPPVCKFFSKTGACKLGSTCLFAHTVKQEVAQTAEISLLQANGGPAVVEHDAPPLACAPPLTNTSSIVASPTHQTSKLTSVGTGQPLPTAGNLLAAKLLNAIRPPPAAVPRPSASPPPGAEAVKSSVVPPLASTAHGNEASLLSSDTSVVPIRRPGPPPNLMLPAQRDPPAACSSTSRLLQPSQPLVPPGFGHSQSDTSDSAPGPASSLWGLPPMSAPMPLLLPIQQDSAPQSSRSYTQPATSSSTSLLLSMLKIHDQVSSGAPPGIAAPTTEAIGEDKLPAERDEQIVASFPSSAAIAAPAPAVHAKRHVARIVHNQPGDLRITLKHPKTGADCEIPAGYYMRPGFRMAVQWKIPCSAVPSSRELSIGLLRYGAYANTPAIVIKSLALTQSAIIRSLRTDELFYAGTMPFFAPKAAGKFVYRLFDPHSRESAVDTLATSAAFSVALVDADILSNLMHVMDAFRDASLLKAISQLEAIISGIKSCGPGNVDCITVLNRCVEKLLDAINASFPVLDEASTRKGHAQAHAQEDEAMAVVADSSSSAEEANFWQNHRIACKVQLEAHAVLCTLMACKTPWYLVTEKLKATVVYMSSLYCPLQRRFFPTQRDLLAGRLQLLHFLPALADYTVPSSALQQLDQCLRLLLPTIFPSYDFLAVRERAREQLQRNLVTEGALPRDVGLVLYGSSCNGFGSAGSDMDMCIYYSSATSRTLEGPPDKVSLIETIGGALARIGMVDIRTRPTARIPIVQFKDPQTGMDGDISVHNALALANTQLLRTYSDIDPRVRSLAFLVKHWAKARHINNPLDGTLSSYGFLLTILHFLQRRPAPLIPSLQQLEPEWMGQRFATDSHPLPSLPRTLERNAAEGRLCDTYFLHPRPDQLDQLKRCAAENHECLAQLLVDYFRYFAWNFDFRHSVVSIRSPRSELLKVDKCEGAAWPPSDNLSIEDPFETWYDVAHVIKAPQMAHIRKEFLRAYTIASRLSEENCSPDGLPGTVPVARFMDLLCEPAPAPVFQKPRALSV